MKIKPVSFIMKISETRPFKIGNMVLQNLRMNFVESSNGFSFLVFDLRIDTLRYSSSTQLSW